MIIPYDHEYVSLVGIATYCFSYYEGTIIDMVSTLDNDFRQRYFRELALTPGMLLGHFGNIDITNSSFFDDLVKCHKDFDKLIKKRNLLLHSHPITDSKGNQVLNYQADVSRTIHDFLWSKYKLQEFIVEINTKESYASSLLMKLKASEIENIK